jgi:sigma-B regulation protein RsbU (phosphoserine phosphatase)
LPGSDFRRPQQVAAALNETFTWDRHNDMFFTIWYGVYHRPTKILKFASCGHPPAILILDSSTIESKSQKLMTANPGIGVMNNIPFPYNRCLIDRTSRLYVFSDGVFEITQENGKEWELNEFVGFLTSLFPTDASILDQLIDHARAMSRTEFFEDDYTMIEIEFT